MIQNILKSALVLSVTTASLVAGEIDVKVVNLTGGSYFTPLLVSTHSDTKRLYTTGSAASTSLQKMAEGGDIADLATELTEDGANVVSNPASGLLAPGANTTATLTTDTTNPRLSIVAMILPTNDGFVALSGWEVPTTAGTYTVNLNAYDAGTEANDEVINGGGAVGVAGIPADPGGSVATGGTGITANVEGFVHIHRGVLGDNNDTGGLSDLKSTKHGWLNPVARAIITVK
ncbi:MAG TPA: hypothetical protein ENK82_00950 [Campylobacterales bacterium]|nr:hypothetical protein [Campylobacterales bacterium]